MRPEPTVDRAAWSGEGEFTEVLVKALSQIEQVAVVRVQDAPPGAAEGYSAFLGNDIFVGFRLKRISGRKSMTLHELGHVLENVPGIGQPDYSDGQMMQYLRTERVEAPYQARSQKIVELVRIYEAIPAK